MSLAHRFTVLLLAAAVALVRGSEWSHADPDHWPGMCQSGKHQSPVDLSPVTAEYIHFDQLTFTNFEKSTDMIAKLNEHTVELAMQQPAANMLSGGGLPGVYYLAQLHFHWGAEHTIQGRRYPLELHFVHYDRKYSGIAEAVKNPRGIAVVGVLFKESALENTKLEAMMEVLERVDGHVDIPMTMRLVPEQLFPQNLTNFYRYDGSLTTPSCDETVIWTVMETVVPISKEQVARFVALRTDHGPIGNNYRPVQTLNGRTLYTTHKVSGGSMTIIPSTSLILLVLIYLF